MKSHLTAFTGLALAGLLVGCAQDAPPTSSSDQSGNDSSSSVDGSKFVLNAEPEGAGDVIKVRADAADGDNIVITGRIGGSENPWIDGRAAFSIVDDSLKACSDIPGDDCPKPWDYCCETDKLPNATALVKLVDENGDLLKADPKGLLDVKELSTVVVQGKAKRDEAGNLTVLATGAFVKKK